MSGLIVVFGACNIDFTCTVEEAPIAQEIVVGNSFHRRFGGRAANQAVAAHKLGGVPVALIGKLGDDNQGRRYYEMLKTMGINTDGLVVGKSLTTGIAQITIAAKREKHIVVIPGANGAIKGEDVLVGKSKDLLEKAEVGLFQCDVDENINLLAMKKMKEDGGGYTILKCSPAEGFSFQLLRYADIIVLNKLELNKVFGMEIIESRDIRLALRQLNMIGIDVAILLLGANGVAFSASDDERVEFVPVDIPECVVDDSGAGDAFCGALAYAIVKLNHLSLDQQIGFACQVATNSVKKLGTQDSYPTEMNVSQFLEDTRDLDELA